MISLSKQLDRMVVDAVREIMGMDALYNLRRSSPAQTEPDQLPGEGRYDPFYAAYHGERGHLSEVWSDDERHRNLVAKLKESAKHRRAFTGL